MLFLEDFKGNMTSSKWAKACKVSQDTAGRELKDLVEKWAFTTGRARTQHSLCAGQLAGFISIATQDI